MLIKELPLDDIIVKDRYRKVMSGLEGLAENIKAMGVIQPITIDEDKKLLAGGRRLAASRLAGLKTIPCLMRKVDDNVTALEIELFENKNRKDLTWVEECNLTHAIHELMKERKGGWGQRKTAKLLDVTQPRIQQRLQMYRAIETVPELAECANEEDARRKLKKMLERSIVQEALESVEKEREEESNLAKSNVKWADNAYIVGDATQLIRKIERGVINFAEVDPPYGIALHEKKSKGTVGIEHYNEIDEDKYESWVKAMAKQVHRVLDHNAWCIWWFGTTWYKEVYTALKLAGFKVDPLPGIWYKVDSSAVSNIPDIYLGRSYETFFMCRKGTPALRKRGRSNVFVFKSVNTKLKRHPTERPIALMDEIFDTFVYPGARVLVPFLGSGVTILSAWKQGLTAFGWDISEEYKEGFLIEALVMMEMEEAKKLTIMKESDDDEEV